MDNREIAVHSEESTQMTVGGIHRQIQLIQEVMKSEMKIGEHYGTIPGCGPKPALMKAGAEKLSLLFKLAPRFKVELVDLGNGHREYRIVTELFHIVTNQFLGEGVGSCSTMETKYRYRNMARKCPACEAEAIIKGKKEYGGGWLCFARKGGCGEKFEENDETIENQEVGKKENEDIADTYNTCLKMGKKRSLVDAVLTATAASDIFTQDIDEMGAAAAEAVPEHREPIAEPAGNQENAVDAFLGDDFKEPLIPAPERKSANLPPKSAPSATPATGLPKDRRRMQSKFDGGTCSACGKKIAKGEWLWKRGESWIHEVC